MPIYLVRWPILSASLVRARDEDDLVDILDQVGNADGCEWSVYRGPLFIDFSLPAAWSVEDARSDRPVTAAQIRIHDLGPLATGHVHDALAVSPSASDDGFEMADDILRLAFPALHAALERLFATADPTDPEPRLSEADLRETLHRELERVLRDSWRSTQLRRRDDPVSRLAAQMDLPVSLARAFLDRVTGKSAEDEGGPAPPAS